MDHDTESFMQSIITGDETWLHLFCFFNLLDFVGVIYNDDEAILT